MTRSVFAFISLLLLLTAACGGDDNRGPGADGGGGTAGVVLADDAAVSGGTGGGGGSVGGGGTAGDTGDGGPAPGPGAGGGTAGSGGETVMDGGGTAGDTSDGGPGADGGEIPSDGNRLSVCYANAECNGDDLVCFGDGGGVPGFCTEDCVEDTDCQPIGGMEATCSPQGECYVACDGEGDTDCPDDMECRQTGGVGSFGCAYPAGTGSGAAGQWESCEVSHGDGDCASGLVCYLPTWPAATSGTGFCTENCQVVTDCTQPDDTSITSVIACGPTAATGTRWCRLDCSVEGSTCPDGMACENVVSNPQQQVLVCRFPLQ
jgi:hypothetical protein